MKKSVLLVSVLILILTVLFGCAPYDASESVIANEQAQVSQNQSAIVQNQPAPNLGGYSFERDILIKTYLARNSTIATYTYSITMDGKIMKLCDSIGYPIPYSTQLTNPMQVIDRYEGDVTMPNPEPNGLFPPGDAAATLIACINPDGTVSPMYWEWYVVAMPYPIKYDLAIERIDGVDSSFSIKVGQ